MDLYSWIFFAVCGSFVFGITAWAVLGDPELEDDHGVDCYCVDCLPWPKVEEED